MVYQTGVPVELFQTIPVQNWLPESRSMPGPADPPVNVIRNSGKCIVLASINNMYVLMYIPNKWIEAGHPLIFH